MNITYDNLKPFLTKENRLWTEDDATMRCEGHEGPWQAWLRLFNEEKPTPADAALVRIDLGDGGCDIYPKGRVHCWAFDGGEIYQLPYEAMVALGLNTAADDLRAALGDGPAAPVDYPLPFNLLVERIQDPNLRSACEALRGYPEFWTWPAAISHHHAYEGGLIAHTIEVAEIALHIAAKFPRVNLDVLLTAALWHDWGKILEYRVTETPAEGERKLLFTHCDAYTDYWVRSKEASTHIATSAIEFSRHANSPAVVHCILAHHGPVREWGSPEAPRTLEALILHQADMLSAGFGATK